MYTKKFLLSGLALMLLAPGLFFGAGSGTAHAQTNVSSYVFGQFTPQSFRHSLGATGWCNGENCDDAFQDHGSANCSVFQVVVTQQPVKDFSGHTFGTGYAFNSYDSTNGTPCHAAWGAIAAAQSEGVSIFNNDIYIGTLNTKVYQGYEHTVGGTTDWFSSLMLSGADLSGNTCISTWFTGTDNQGGGTGFSIKLIGGGSNC